jgi:D-glycero-D-manno-heptose 1,7-bisphosphate phosphatase|tara:strand:- start:4199 stop:4750 length:552 start_codon:yes stop_codon:yes gene_type:complete
MAAGMKLVILDRDGVINHDSPEYIKTPEEWLPIEGSLEAIANLHEHGFTVCVATNQAGIGRGLYSLQDLERIHSKMLQAVADAGGKITAVFYCPHHPSDDCACRKPRPGLIHQLADQLKVSVAGVPLVGDKLTDIQAGMAAGCKPILVETGSGRLALDKLPNPGIPVYPDLAGAAAAIIAGEV